MKIRKLKQFTSGLAFGISVLLMASCKPAEETKPQAVAGTNSAPAATPIAATNAPATNAPVHIGPTKAREHIGEQVTVRGLVSDVHVTQKGDVFLNFGGKFPNSVFSAVCFKSAIPTEQLTALKGKTIAVSGKVKDYNGQVEIVLESAEQITQ